MRIISSDNIKIVQINLLQINFYVSVCPKLLSLKERVLNVLKKHFFICLIKSRALNEYINTN